MRVRALPAETHAGCGPVLGPGEKQTLGVRRATCRRPARGPSWWRSRSSLSWGDLGSSSPRLRAAPADGPSTLKRGHAPPPPALQRVPQVLPIQSRRVPPPGPNSLLGPHAPKEANCGHSSTGSRFRLGLRVGSSQKSGPGGRFCWNWKLAQILPEPGTTVGKLLRHPQPPNPPPPHQHEDATPRAEQRCQRPGR